ncbi:MAG: hypothetical protein HYR72_14265 [Deltaproteobacteria bacterium]|nr:hypothetical protein [Deltaproteobacteria bacterium]MBI3391508.1 hypothetical protein [Deltaproteobacteria bacterium]
MTVRAIAYPRIWRVAAAVLITISGASVPVMLGAVLTRTRPITPQMLIQAFSVLAIAPAVAGWLIERAFAARLEIKDGALVIDRGEARVEIPCGAIARITPWVIPLPGSGLSLGLRSGRRVRYGLHLADPSVVLEMLTRAGGPQSALTLLQHPSVVYARAKHRARWRWYHLVFKFVVFALVPTLPLFRVQQLIVWGDPFGQYYLRGLQPYAQEFGLYWAQVAIALVLYAGVWRGLAEAAALLAAWAAPSRAARVRQVAEVGCSVLYYAGVPALLIRHFLPW